MKKLFLIFFFFLIVNNSCADNGFGGSFVDFGPNSAFEIWLDDPNGNFGTTASPPSVQSALDELGASKPSIHTSDMPDTGGTNDDHDPRYYTKDEVNDIVEGAAFDFFLNDTNSDISAPTQYFVMDPTLTGEAESSFSDTITNDAFLIDTFATSTSEPTFTELIIGVYTLHIHADTTTGASTGTARLYFELWKRTHPGAVETLLITSEESNLLTGVKTSLEIHGSLTADTVLDVTDRLVIKVYANIEVSRPTDPVVTFYAEGTTSTLFEVKTTIAAFDDRYIEVLGDTYAGVHDAGGATSFEIPNDAAPTLPNVTGEVVVDTNLITQGMMQVYLASAIANIVATTDTPADNEVPTYDSGGGTVQWEAGGGGAGTYFKHFTIQAGKLTGGDITNSMGIDAGERPWRGLLDDSTEEEVTWQFVCDPNYASGTLTLEILFSVVTTQSGDKDVKFDVKVMAATSGDAEDWNTDGFAAERTVTHDLATDQVAGRPRLATITFTQAQADGMNIDDIVRVHFARDVGVANDATGDVEIFDMLWHE
ncbi:MAG TPA: hypothetical protein ENH85_14080 [Candidatus Scalindua sp.]|nr:hypothetical protein [Candidatus Scalindua sp.]